MELVQLARTLMQDLQVFDPSLGGLGCGGFEAELSVLAVDVDAEDGETRSTGFHASSGCSVCTCGGAAAAVGIVKVAEGGASLEKPGHLRCSSGRDGR